MTVLLLNLFIPISSSYYFQAILQGDYYANATIKTLFSASFSESCSIYPHSLSLMGFSDKKERINVFVSDPTRRELSMRSTTATEIYKTPSHPSAPRCTGMTCNAPAFRACWASLTSSAVLTGTPRVLLLTVLPLTSSPNPVKLGKTQASCFCTGAASKDQFTVGRILLLWSSKRV